MIILHPKFHRTISMFRAIEDNCKTLIKCSPSLVRVMTKKIGEGEITTSWLKHFKPPRARQLKIHLSTYL